MCLFSMANFAQVNLSIGQVKKINITDAGGYLGGGYRNQYELLLENGKWHSYQTREKYDRRNFKPKTPSEFFEHRDSLMHRFIKTVANDSLTQFLKSLSTIKPKFFAAELKVSIPKLRQQIDTAYLKYLPADKHAIFHSFYDTPQKLNTILEALQKGAWTDDWPLVAIEVVKTTGDTIKVQTTRQVDFMLPWKINGTPTYDLNLNRFFMTATGLANHRANGRNLAENVQSDVHYRYAANVLERLRWEEIAPANTAYLKQHFEIIRISKSNDQSSYSFKPLKAANKKVVIHGTLDIAKKEQLQKLVNFAEDTLHRFFKRPAFMTDTCKETGGCEIRLVFSLGASNHNVFTMFTPELAEFLAKFDAKTLVPFTVYAGERTEDNWVALPDGRFVLTAYVDDKGIGINRYIVPDGAKHRKFVFMVFDGKGNLLKAPY